MLIRFKKSGYPHGKTQKIEDGMTRDEFDLYCKALPAATHVVQWGNSSVWKVGGKIFALCSRWGKGDGERISFKCSDLSFRILCEQPNISPAPYLGRFKWAQLQSDSAMNDTDIEAYIAEAHTIVAAKLTRALKKELGLS